MGSFVCLHSARNLCDLCGVYKHVVEAVVDGHLPSLFQGARNATERDQVLNEVVVGSIGIITANTEESMNLFMKGSRIRVSLLVDPEEQSDFRVWINGYEKIGFLKETRFGPSTDSDRSFSRAQQWLRQCLENHDCGESRGSFQPCRLLNLHGNRVRLIETTEASDFQGPYVCLSHRWGDANTSRLISTTDNIHNHMKGIEWSNIPKTFQDAIVICRRLGVDYLWIDTLCILQEFPGMSDEKKRVASTDFAAENSVMARISQSSYFTIYGSVSTSMASSIFSPKLYGSHQIKNLANAEEWWAGILRQYTMRRLAKEEDKLPALSGLAQLYHQLTRDTYLAGLWKASFPHCLCWYNTAQAGTYTMKLGIGRRSRTPRVHSWSWASLDIVNDAQCRFWWPRESLSTNPIIYEDGATSRPVCTVQEAICQLKTDDLFGEVVGGSIDLGVLPVSAKIGTKSQGDESFSTVGDVAWTLDYVEDGTDVHICLADCSLDDDDLQMGDEVYCAPIMEAISESGSDRGRLVLKCVLGGSEFRRRGFCVLRKKNPSWDRANSPLPMVRPLGHIYPDLTTPEYAEKVQSYALLYNPSAERRIRII
ncbi:hypothetical protein CSAL01_07862 [Colletotrichum salicis]|uniref:Heterokaryon incompatibility domain-containing protein n=1 Tax=Colletotrichum salicis TaxID=1209931 RepID=A0A135T0E1_9PEZI|nr:hypothetical protein CSAL01_07862 [Colletotrichum salicis]